MGPDDADAPDAEDDPGAGPRPDPLDRPWVHPSELRSFVATPEAPPAAPPRPREWVIGITSAIAAVLATVLILSAFGAIGGRHRSPIRPPAPTTPDEALDYGYAVRVYESMGPSVVTVSVKVGDTTTNVSGVAVTGDRVLTSAHAVGSANAVITIVTQPEGRSFTAKLVGTDPDTDLALLDVPQGDLAFPPLASGSEPSVGQALVALGAGRGGPYVGMNVLEERNLLVPTPWGATLAGLMRSGISTPTDSTGGGLFDVSGRVVGILVTVPGDGRPGLAIPISVAKDVQTQLDATGKVAHAWFGVDGQDAADRPDGGARILTVAPGSPAEKAGILPGDVVTRVGNVAIRTYADLVAEWRRRHPGDSITLTFVHGAQAKPNVQISLAAQPG
jgi:putative serine protease PepD